MGVQTGFRVPANRRFLSHATVEVGGTAVALPSIDSAAEYAVIQNDEASAAIRWTPGGAAPTTGSVGFVLHGGTTQNNSVITIDGATDIAAFRAIENVAATAVTLKVAYYG